MLTKGAIGNLINRYKAVLKKCNLINTFGSLAVASMLVLGGAGVAGATATDLTQYLKDAKYVDEGNGVFVYDPANSSVLSSGKYSISEDGADIAILSPGKNNITGGEIDLKEGQSLTLQFTEPRFYTGGVLGSDIGTGIDDIFKITGNGNVTIKSDNENSTIPVHEAGLGQNGNTEINGKDVTIYSDGYSGIYQNNGTHSIKATGEVAITGHAYDIGSGGHGIYLLDGGTGKEAKVSITDFSKLTIKSISGEEYTNSIGNKVGGDDNYAIGNQGGELIIQGNGDVFITADKRTAFASFAEGNDGAVTTIDTSGKVEITTTVSDDNSGSGRKGSAAYIAAGTTTIEADGGIKIADYSNREGKIALGVANGGNIILKAGDNTIELDGNIATVADFDNKGDTGNITVDSGNLSVKNGTVSGYTGNVVINEGASVTLSKATGMFGGNVDMKGGTLNMTDLSDLDKDIVIKGGTEGTISFSDNFTLNANIIHAGDGSGIGSRTIIAQDDSGNWKDITINGKQGSSKSALNCLTSVTLKGNDINIYSDEALHADGRGIYQIAGTHTLEAAGDVNIIGKSGGNPVYVNNESVGTVSISAKGKVTLQSESYAQDDSTVVQNNGGTFQILEAASVDILGANRSAITAYGKDTVTSITSTGDVLVSSNISDGSSVNGNNAKDNLGGRKDGVIYSTDGTATILSESGKVTIQDLSQRDAKTAISLAYGSTVTLGGEKGVEIVGDIKDGFDYKPQYNDGTYRPRTEATAELVFNKGALTLDGSASGYTGNTTFASGASYVADNAEKFFGGSVSVKGGTLTFAESFGDVKKAFTVHNVPGSKVDTSAVKLVGDDSATGQYVIHVSGTTVDGKLEQKAVINNSALTDGASVKIDSVSVDADGVIVIDKAIIHSVADKDANDSYPAVIHNAGGDISITNSEFKGNKDSTTERYAYGSVIYGDANSSLNISNSLFEGNEVASSYGDKRSYGTIHHSGDLTITNSQFKGNISDYMSGALRVNSGTFTGNTFEGNKANGGAGGAIYLSDSATFTDNTFTNNYSASEGGAISLENNKAKATTVSFLGTNTFTGNKANTTGVGGAINIHNTDDVDTLTVNIEGQASFSANTANSGGAIYNKSVLNIDGAEFSGNIASYGGGAIYSTGGGELTVDNSTFTGNKASIGGAIVEGMGAEKTTIIGSTFEGNVAYKDGGALALNGPETIIEDSTFSGNIAGFENGAVDGATSATTDGGGAIHLGGTTHVTMTDVEFTNNVSAVRGGAISARHGKGYTLTIKGKDKAVLFSGNQSGKFGGAIANVYAGTVDVTNAEFIGNTAKISGGAIYNGSDTNYGSGGSAGVTSTNHGTINLTDVTFTGNKAVELGGAIYNDSNADGHGTINFAGTNEFSENSDKNGANDIFNAGVVNVNSGVTKLNSGYKQTTDAKLNINDGTLVVDFGSIMKAYDDVLVDINGKDGILNLDLGGKKYTASNVESTKKALFDDGENTQLNFVNGELVKGDDENLIATGITDNSKEMTISEKPVVAIEGQQSFEEASDLGQHVSSLEEMLKIVDDSDDHELADVDSVKFDLTGTGDSDKKLTVQGIQTLADKISVAAGTELSLYGTGSGLVTDENGTAKAADMLVKGNLNLGVDSADGMAGTLRNIDVDGGKLNIVDGFDLTADSLAVQNKGELSATELEAKNLSVKSQGKLSAKSLKANGLDVLDAELSADKLTTSGTSSIKASNLGDTALKVKELVAEAGSLAMEKIEAALESLTADQADVSIKGSKLEVGSFTVAEGDVSVEGSSLEIGELVANGGSIFIDPTDLTVAKLAGGELNSDVYIGEGSTFNLGGYDLTKAPVATATLAIGAGQSIAVKSGSLVVDGKLIAKPATAPADGSATFAKDSLLAVDASSVSGGTAALTGIGKLTVEAGAKLYLSDSAANQTYTIADFAEADVKGWQQQDTTLTDGSTAAETITNGLLKATTEVKDGVVTVVTAKDVESEFFTEGLPTSALHELADKGARVDDASMGKKFLSRATDGGSQYVSASTDTVEAINEVSRAAITASVQNTSLRIADASSNTVLSHMSLAQHDGSKAIHADGVDFWAAPMYGNLYTSGMVTSGSSVRGQFGGLALGADLEAGQFLGGTFRLGAAINGGGGQSETKGTATSTQNDYDFGGLNFYAGWNSGALNVIASVGYGFGNHEVEMRIPVAGVNKAKADIDTSAFTADLRAEYQLKTPYVDILPHAGIRYTALKTDAHDLKVGGSVLNSVQSDTQNIVQFPLGVTLSKDFNLAGWTVKPSADVSVIPAAGDKKATTKVNFSGLDAWDSMNTRVMDSTSWAGTIGIQAEKGNMTFGLNYGVQASSHETDQNIQVKFGWKF